MADFAVPSAPAQDQWPATAPLPAPFAGVLDGVHEQSRAFENLDSLRGFVSVDTLWHRKTQSNVPNAHFCFAHKIWRPVTVHEVVAEFLRSERYKFPETSLPELMSLTETPDIKNAHHNHRRLRLLYILRRHIFGEIPPDTQWYEVRNLTDRELDDLHVIARIGWDWRPNPDNQHPEDKNEVRKVAKRRPLELIAPSDAWPRPILWGHEKTGPFTIIEGNNRLIAYVGSRQTGLDIPVLIGLSATPCPWHIFDPAKSIVNDLWQHTN
jgi:hypothetical protein